jgi:hypothetical protein
MVRKTLPEFTAWLFPEYTFGKMSLRTHRHIIMERIPSVGCGVRSTGCLTPTAKKRYEIG